MAGRYMYETKTRRPKRQKERKKEGKMKQRKIGKERTGETERKRRTKICVLNVMCFSS